MYRTKSFTLIILGLSLIMSLSGCIFKASTSGEPEVEIGSIRQKAGGETQIRMTEAELQSEVMSFADRFASLILQAYEEFDASNPPLEQRRFVLRNAVFSTASAFTIASESDPDVALLDMVVMITLGHMIYEEHWQPMFGASVAPMERGFRKAEVDVWQIAAKLLRPDQQAELMTLIREWRQEHREELAFTYVRFSDFAAKRRRSTLARAEGPRGVLQSVEMATRHVEDIKLLAERKMFLATRMPLLTGYFLDMSMSQVFVNPQVETTLDSLQQAAESSAQLAAAAKELTTMIFSERQEAIAQVLAGLAIEREAAINQAMDRLAVERKNTLEELLAEEARLKGILSELKETLVAGHKLAAATNSLAERLALGDVAEGSEPFDVKDYQEALSEATATITQFNMLIGETNQMLNSPGWENLLPKLERTIGQVRLEGEEVVDYTFLRGVFLLLLWLLGYFAIKLSLYKLTKQRNL